MNRTAAAAVNLARKGVAPGTAENRLAGPSESCANTRPAAGLQQDYEDQCQTDNNMDNVNESNHNKFI